MLLAEWSKEDEDGKMKRSGKMHSTYKQVEKMVTSERKSLRYAFFGGFFFFRKKGRLVPTNRNYAPEPTLFESVAGVNDFVVQ